MCASHTIVEAAVQCHATQPHAVSEHAIVRAPQGVMHVEVVAVVTKPEQVRSDVTNTFHFVFSTEESKSSQPKKLKRVLPGTREEAMSILQFAPQDELQPM